MVTLLSGASRVAKNKVLPPVFQFKTIVEDKVVQFPEIPLGAASESDSISSGPNLKCSMYRREQVMHESLTYDSRRTLQLAGRPRIDVGKIPNMQWR